MTTNTEFPELHLDDVVALYSVLGREEYALQLLQQEIQELRERRPQYFNRRGKPILKEHRELRPTIMTDSDAATDGLRVIELDCFIPVLQRGLPFHVPVRKRSLVYALPSEDRYILAIPARLYLDSRAYLVGLEEKKYNPRDITLQFIIWHVNYSLWPFELKEENQYSEREKWGISDEIAKKATKLRRDIEASRGVEGGLGEKRDPLARRMNQLHREIAEFVYTNFDTLGYFVQHLGGRKK